MSLIHIRNEVFLRAIVLGVLTVAGPAHADFTTWHFESYPAIVEGNAYAVIDVYAEFDGTTDTVLNVFNSHIANVGGTAFHHSDYSTLAGEPGSWAVQQSANDMSSGLDASIDSFVTVGGEVGGGNTTALDPSFSPSDAPVPPENGGWYNSNPLNLQGRVDPATQRTLVARFVKAGLASGDSLSWSANMGYNQGLGTFAQFAYEDALGSGPTFTVEYVGCGDPGISPMSSSVAASGGLVSVQIEVDDSNCAWAATASVSWIAFPSGSAGVGSGNLEFLVGINDSADAREGLVLVNGVTHSVMQSGGSCAVVSIGDEMQDFPVAGGTHSFTVATNGSACGWAAYSSSPWVTITSGATGTGLEGTITYDVAANPNAIKRSALILVGTIVHMIVQAPAECAVVGLSSYSADFGSSGGSGAFTVSTNGNMCSWAATSSASWVTIVGDDSGTGTNGVLTYEVADNPIAVARSATIEVAGLVHTIDQAAAPCEVLAIDPTQAAFDSGGGEGSFALTTNGGDCGWSATASVSWISITSGSGSGLAGTVGYLVSANPLAETRVGSVIVDGLEHEVTQGPAPCAVVSIDPSSITASAAGGEYSMLVTSNGSNCVWAAATSDSWISLTMSEGVGTSTLSFTVSENPSTYERSGSISVEGLVLELVQMGQPCEVTGFSPGEASFEYGGGLGSTTISTNGGNCTWSAVSNDPWISISSGGTGEGEGGVIEFSVEMFSGVESRIGSIIAGGEAFSISQSGGSDCNANGIGDAYELANGISPDCNENGVPDSCDIADGNSPDENGNGIPDECEVGYVALVPADFPTIQAAIDGSVAGWIVRVAPGTYSERIALGGRDITVEAMEGATETIIDGTGMAGSVVTMIAPAGNADPGPTLRGFTIRGGTLGTIVGNSVNYGGGGLYAAYCNGSIENCTFSQNTAAFGGGAYVFRSHALLSGCIFTGNQAGSNGGGLLVFRGASLVESCVVRDNFAISQSGGVHVVGGDSSLVDVEIRENEALVVGGGLGVYAEFGVPDGEDGTATYVSGCVIEANLCQETGGGLWVRPGFDTVYVDGTTICGNEPDEISGDFTDLGGNTLCNCPADITGNGEVNGADLAELLASWGTCGSCSADLDGDGIVNGLDLAIVLSAWGACP